MFALLSQQSHCESQYNQNFFGQTIPRLIAIVNHNLDFVNQLKLMLKKYLIFKVNARFFKCVFLVWEVTCF